MSRRSPDVNAKAWATRRAKYGYRGQGKASPPASARLDLDEERFGKLVVVRFVGMRGHESQWLCRCDCGGEKIASRQNLRRGYGLHCGCDAKDYSRNIAGLRSGLLVAVERAGSDRQGRAMWRCECDCGGEAIVRSAHIGNHHARSCGCLYREVRASNFAKGRQKGVARPRKTKAQAQIDLTNIVPMHGFDHGESAAIAAAIAAGKVTRIENGEWPDAGRLDDPRRASWARGNKLGAQAQAGNRRVAKVAA